MNRCRLQTSAYMTGMWSTSSFSLKRQQQGGYPLDNISQQLTSSSSWKKPFINYFLLLWQLPFGLAFSFHTLLNRDSVTRRWRRPHQGQSRQALGCPPHPGAPASLVVAAAALSLSRVWLFCNPMYWSLPGSSVHGILQAEILVWVAISSSRGSSWPRDGYCISCIGRGILHWATKEARPCLFICC